MTLQIITAPVSMRAPVVIDAVATRAMSFSRPMTVLNEHFLDNLHRLNVVTRLLRKLGYRIISAKAQGKPEIRIAPGGESSTRPVVELANGVLYIRNRRTACAHVDGVLVTWEVAS